MEYPFDYLDNEMNSIFESKKECENDDQAKQLAKNLFANSMQNDLYAIEVRYYTGYGYSFFFIN